MIHTPAPATPLRIPFFNYPAIYEQNRDELTAIITDICRRGAYILQRDLVEFEQALARYAGVKHAIGVANCTDGLEMILQLAGIGKGDEVIVSAHTFIATASAVAFNGATPVAADIGADSQLIDPASVESLITPRTRAIMPTQLNGHVCDMKALSALALRHGLLLIEDAAQSLGAQRHGQQAGTFGLASALSFYPAKLLGCLGDGGAVLTNDDHLAQRLRQLRDHGRGPTGEVTMWGRNSRLDNLQAAILSFYLSRYPAAIARRRAIADLYRQQLADIPHLQLPESYAIASASGHEPVYQNYEIQADQRDGLKASLLAQGIGTLVQWSGFPLHRHTALGMGVGRSLPRTDRYFQRCIMLPLHMALSDEHVLDICTAVRAFYKNAGR